MGPELVSDVPSPQSHVYSVMVAPLAPVTPVAVGGPLDFLPDVPGGIVTYAIGAYFLYRHLKNRKRARS